MIKELEEEYSIGGNNLDENPSPLVKILWGVKWAKLNKKYRNPWHESCSEKKELLKRAKEMNLSQETLSYIPYYPGGIWKEDISILMGILRVLEKER